MVTVETPIRSTSRCTWCSAGRKVDTRCWRPVCAENNFDYFNQNLFPIPEAVKPDF